MKTLLTILLFLLCWTQSARPESEAERDLSLHNQLKLQLDEKVTEVSRIRNGNQGLSRDICNLEMSVAQMELVLGSIRNPAAPQSPSLPVGMQEVERQTLVEIELRNESDLKAFGIVRAQDFKFGAIDPDQEALRIEQDSTSSSQNARLILWLQADRIEGKRVVCSVRIKGDGISSESRYGGGKFALCIAKLDGKSLWPDATIGLGAFDWKDIRFSSEIPIGIKSCFLMIGLQNASGKIYYRDLKIEVLD